MNLVVLGATGPTGIEIVRKALQAGHDVTGIVRNPLKMPIAHERLTLSTANILDIEALTIALIGHDGVLSALGGGRDLHSDIVSKAVSVLIPAMGYTGIKRVIFLSSFGVAHTKSKAKPPARLFFSTALKHILQDKEKADTMLRQSSLDYTLVYPTRLTNGEYTGRYRADIELDVGWFPRISRADVADFMVREVVLGSWLRQTVILSN